VFSPQDDLCPIVSMQLVNAGDLSPSTDTSISLTADPDVNGDL